MTKVFVVIKEEGYYPDAAKYVDLVTFDRVYADSHMEEIDNAPNPDMGFVYECELDEIGHIAMHDAPESDTRIDSDKAALRIGRGVEVLDQQRPGWADEIQLEYLEMASGVSCVLGQVFDGYTTGLVELLSPEYEGNEYAWSAEHGFVNDVDNGVYYDDLQNGWMKVIKERQTKDA